MATRKQSDTAKKNVRKAQEGAKKKKSLANMPSSTKTALGKQGAAVAQRERTGSSSPKTRPELYEEAKRRDLQGRSKMGRDELARALGQKSHAEVGGQVEGDLTAHADAVAPRQA
jgi:hypothetical protein